MKDLLQTVCSGDKKSPENENKKALKNDQSTGHFQSFFSLFFSSPPPPTLNLKKKIP